MKTILLLLVCVAFSAVGCSIEPAPESKPAKTSNKLDSGHLKCWSGGVVIYDGDSIGNIQERFHGYKLYDAADGKARYISGDCIATIEEHTIRE